MKKKVFTFMIGSLVKLIYVPVACFGQVMTNNNVAITVNGAQVTVKGDIQNNSGTSINNNAGTIDLSGNWINNSGGNVFGTSAGTVVMNGTNQNISGSNSTTFNNLTVQGSGAKTLQVSTSVGGGYGTPAGSLALDASVLNLNSNTLFVTNPNAAGITYAAGSIRSEAVNNSSKVDWDMQNVQGGHIVPFSNNAGTVIPFKYELTDNNYHGHVVMSTYAANSANLPYPVVPSLVTDVNTLGDGNPANMVHRFWQVDVQNTGVLSSLTFTFDPATETPSGAGTLYAQNWNNSGAWNTASAFQAVLGPDSIQLYNNDKYGTFGIGKNGPILPVTLVTFYALLNSGVVYLSWITAAEINNDYFTVQRSVNGTDFETVAIVDGAGNSTQILNYEVEDPDPYHGISYYRLKQTDYDGATSYSQTVIINNISSAAASQVMVYPNPVTEYALITLNPQAKNTGSISFELYDVNGKQVMASRLSQLNSFADNVYRLERGDLHSGAYFYRMINGSEKVADGKLVVQ